MIDMCYKPHGTAAKVDIGYKGTKYNGIGITCDSAPEAICKAALLAVI
jgi:hypothetical protein